MKLFKRIISISLVAIMTLGVLPVYSSAYSEDCPFNRLSESFVEGVDDGAWIICKNDYNRFDKTYFNMYLGIGDMDPVSKEFYQDKIFLTFDYPKADTAVLVRNHGYCYTTDGGYNYSQNLYIGYTNARRRDDNVWSNIGKFLTFKWGSFDWKSSYAFRVGHGGNQFKDLHIVMFYGEILDVLYGTSSASASYSNVNHNSVNITGRANLLEKYTASYSPKNITVYCGTAKKASKCKSQSSDCSWNSNKSFKFNNLKANTKYYYRVKIKTNDNQTVYSSWKTFTTKKTTPKKVSTPSVKKVIKTVKNVVDTIGSIINAFRNLTQSRLLLRGDTLNEKTPDDVLVRTNDVGAGDPVALSWDADPDSEYYTVSIDGVEQERRIYGTDFTYMPVGSETELTETVTSQVRVRGHNTEYTGEWSDPVTVTVHPDVNVTFLAGDDDIGYTEYQTNTLKWGDSLNNMPEAPTRAGHYFKGWFEQNASTTASFKDIKKDLVVYSKYSPASYDVRFLDPKGNVIPVNGQQKQTVAYGGSAAAPDDLSAYIPSGYKFVGWNKSCDNITENTDIKAVIDYENYNLPVTVSVSDAVRYNYGYVVNCTVNNQTAKDSYGRIIVALKSDQGKLIKTTESSAYYISPHSSKNVEVLVPVYDDELDKTVTASVAEVYAVENFKTTVPVSEVVRANVTDSDPYTQWYDADDPEQNQYSGYDRDSQTLYRCRDLDRTTAFSETQRDALINTGWVYTGEFTKSDAPVSTANGAWSKTAPEKPDDTDSLSYSIETKTVTDTPQTTYYNYKRYKYVNGGTTYYSYGSTWATSHGLSGTWEYKRVTTERTQTDTIDGYKYYGGWFRADCNKKQGTKYTVYKETVPAKTHTEYRLVTKTYAVSYGLEKWLDWSDYSTDVITATATREVGTKTQYRYNLGVVPRIEDNSGVERDDFCLGNAGAEFAGKQATLFIYKINEASDWTTEYLAQTVIGPDGTYEFDTYKLRQEPSDKTGDFTATLGIEGSDSAVYLGKIEAPKPVYKVEYVDSVTGNVIGSPQMVEEGESASAPEAPEHEGYTFLYWDMRSTNICQDFSVEKNNAINAVYGINQYSVTWIDWERQQYKVQTYGYGEQLTIPDEMKGGDTETAAFIGWDKLIDGVTAVTSDMVVCSVYETREYTVTYADPEGNVVKEEQAKYGEPVLLEQWDETEQVIFTDEWDVVTEDEDLTVDDYFTVTSDTTVTPRYYFQNTAETPVADIRTGSYGSAQTVTLTSETETAAIYYTLDGSDPALQSSEAILYTQPITISGSCELRAYATAMNMNPSDEIHEYYAVGGNQCILYVDNEGLKEDGVYIVDKNETLDSSLFPTFEGHTFRNAYIYVPSDVEIVDIDGNPVVTYVDGSLFNIDTDVITEDTRLHFYYDTDVYKVYFIGKNGAVISEQDIEYGEAATPPEAPEVEGFVFTGWDSDSYLSVTEDNLMINAKYIDEEHYVRVELEDNYISMQAGRNTNIVYTVTGNVAEPEIECTSSDDSVATAELKTVIRDGETVNVINVEAISKGTAQITLTSVDSGETAVCEIDVSNNPKQIITLKSTSYLQADESGYIRGFTLTTEDGTHYTETVEEIRSQFATPGAKLSFFDASGNLLAETDHIGTGTVISYTNSDGETSAFTAVVSGDMDGDGFVSNRDRTALLRCVVGKATPTPIQLSAMDVNADGSINNKDVTLIGLYLVNKAAF